jgi:hypothetical protein
LPPASVPKEAGGNVRTRSLVESRRRTVRKTSINGLSAVSLEDDRAMGSWSAAP